MNIANTSLFINKHSVNSKGKCSITVRVTFDRKKKYYPTGISLSIEEFEKLKSDKIQKDLKEIFLKLQSFEKKAADIIKDLAFFTFQSFEKKYYTNKAARDSVNLSFKEYISDLRQEGRVGTADSYECARVSFNKFAPDVKFIEVTSDLLNKYEKWMVNQNKSITTVGIYLRSLRTLFNSAINEGLLQKEFYPFGKKRYELPTSNNKKKALNLNEIAKIYNFEAEIGSPTERAKDLWFFIYLCNGINVKDLCLLKYENIQGDNLVFERAKTAKTKRNVEPIRLPLSDDALEIIEKWGNKKLNNKTFVFPILEAGLNPDRERQLIKQINQVINAHMKHIASALGITNIVTTYAARHSFATILQRSGASTEFISEALGHSNVKTTQNYLAGFEDGSKREINRALTAFKTLITK